MDTPICKMCRQNLTGFDTVFNDSGAGIVVTRCPRCHHLSHHLDQGAIELFNKQAGALDAIKDALMSVGPAVATMGIWDLLVAYNTFKKVMDNTLRIQRQQQSLTYDPMYASGNLTKKADDDADNSAIKPRDDVESVMHPNPNYLADPEKMEEIKVSLDEVTDFLQKIIPTAVSYAIERQDVDVLKALGRLGNVIREARKSYRLAREQDDRTYDRTYLMGSPESNG